MKRPEPPESLEPGKPAAEMTPDELAGFRASLRREVRQFRRPGLDSRLRQGRVRPRTLAETEIFAADLLGKRESRGDPRPG